MKLRDNGITNVETWEIKAPPMGKSRQWVDGRSAKELARYMTKNYPQLPIEIENILKEFVRDDSEFDWAAEYVTRFEPFGLGRGEGRNHDAFLYRETRSEMGSPLLPNTADWLCKPDSINV